MPDLKLNPNRIADAMEKLETCFDSVAKSALDGRAQMIIGMPESKYKEELMRCERTNEANYNSILPSVRNLRASLNDVKEVAEALAKRELETTKARESQSKVEVTDAVAALRPF